MPTGPNRHSPDTPHSLNFKLTSGLSSLGHVPECGDLGVFECLMTGKISGLGVCGGSVP